MNPIVVRPLCALIMVLSTAANAAPDGIQVDPATRAGIVRELVQAIDEQYVFRTRQNWSPSASRRRKRAERMQTSRRWRSWPAS